MNDLAARLRATYWWLLPLVVLAALIGWETDWGREVETPAPAPEAVTPKPVVAVLLPEYEIVGGVATRTETVQRTLFNPTRRPAPPVAPEGAANRLQRGQFALTGTMQVDGKSTAFLREVAGNRSRRVQQGESINGMLVAEVKPDRVKLTMGDESEELMLKVASNPRPTVQPPVAALGAPPTIPGAAQAAAAQLPPPGTPGAPENPQTLAERRRAARAAQLAAGGAATPPEGGAAPPVPMAAPPVTPANAAAAAAPTTPDPRWQEVYRRYQQQQR